VNFVLMELTDKS